LRPILTLLALTLAGSASSAPDDRVVEAIRGHVEELGSRSELQIGEARVASVPIVPELYQRRGFRPAWNRDSAEQLLALIRTAEQHGLDSADYHLAELERLGARVRAGGDNAELLADYDVLLTDALLRVAYHAVFGKVDPESLDPHWNLTRDLDPDTADPADEIQRIIDSGSIGAGIDALAPEETAYRELRQALERYNRIADAGGWEPLPPGPKLERGSEGERVVALRRRLAASGDLSSADVESAVFDEGLEQAVIRFQRRNRLDADGVVGPGSLTALNTPVEARIDQIRVNLERARWVLHELPGDFVLVDVAGFRAEYYRGDEPVWSSRVQVGRPYRKTPVFRGDIRYLVFNPTWTVPPGILARDVLPAIQRDVGYLEKRKLGVFDADGNRVDPDSLDWASYGGRSFPYRIVQPPGPNNALGRIKFIFPNDHLVFLHDTPSRSLFEKTDRAFSSGCIRVEEPFELAELLLDDSERWNRDRILAAIEAGRTQTVLLPEPVPVVLLYWTVEVDPDGTVHFKKDLYERDPPIRAALREDFQFRASRVGAGPQPR
jgi:murein L,D-transpeptidase YcbB/YkuD